MAELETPPWWERVEPRIELHHSASRAEFATVSIAISLKRIADIMEKAVGDGAQLDSHFLHDAAYVAGQAFERGRR